MNNNQYSIAKKMFLEGKSLRSISLELKIDRKRLSKKLKEDNISIIKGISDRDLLKAYKEVKLGKSLTSVAKEFKVDRHTLSKRLKDMNLIESKDVNRNRSFDKEILRLYSENNSIEKISNELNISTNMVWLCLRENNYSINNYRKYNFNEDAFEIIDNEEKAYWLGFLYADGYVSDRGVELALAKKDKSHIDAFQKFLNSNYNVRYLEKTNAYRVNISSVKLSKDLTRLGCFQNKSLKLKFPTEEQVPKKLIHHFMRGYFDGDGCVYNAKQINRKSFQLGFSVIGTKEFLDEYDKILLSLGINKTKYQREGNAYSVNHGGNIQVRKIYDFLYKDSTIYLDRKYKKFNCRLETKLQKSQDD